MRYTKRLAAKSFICNNMGLRGCGSSPGVRTNKINYLAYNGEVASAAAVASCPHCVRIIADPVFSLASGARDSPHLAPTHQRAALWRWQNKARRGLTMRSLRRVVSRVPAVSTGPLEKRKVTFTLFCEGTQPWSSSW